MVIAPPTRHGFPWFRSEWTDVFPWRNSTLCSPSIVFLGRTSVSWKVPWTFHQPIACWKETLTYSGDLKPTEFLIWFTIHPYIYMYKYICVCIHMLIYMYIYIPHDSLLYQYIPTHIRWIFQSQFHPHLICFSSPEESLSVVEIPY
jgi:hypothetical protein